jgi:hypothetical protein
MPHFDVLQKNMKQIILLGIVLSLLFTGCGKPTIDTSSDEKLKASIEKVKASLPDEQKERFEEAVQIVAFSEMDLSSFFAASQADTGSMERKMKEALDGLSAEEVIGLAVSIKAEREIESQKEEKERELKELQREKEREQNRKVAELLSRARELKRDNDLMDALTTYKEALALDGDSEAAIEGVEETLEEIDEFKEKQAYLSSIDLYDFEASTIDTYRDKGIPSVKFKLKNNGNRSLSKVEVTVYLKDESGNVIAEEDFHPVLVSEYRFSGNNKPLKAGYIWEMERGKWYTIKDAPSEWKVGNAEAKITDIRFEK